MSNPFSRTPMHLLSPSEALEKKEFYSRFDSALDALTARYLYALLCRFFEGKTFREIGTDLGVSRSRASQMTAQALRTTRRTIIKSQSPIGEWF